MSRYEHKIETSLEGIEHLSKDKKGERERKKKEEERPPATMKSTVDFIVSTFGRGPVYLSIPLEKPLFLMVAHKE